MMSDSSNLQQPRALLPRRLDQKETLQSLNHWKSTFRNFYRRCPYYGLFLIPSTRWDNSDSRGFTSAETTGLKRDVETLAADLVGFLDCVAGYIPFDYVADKLRDQTTCIDSVWDIVYEIYDAELTTTNFLDYATMKREDNETYRSFFNRLVGFVRQHLPRKAHSAEGISSPNDGEGLTIALLDSITIHWLLTIDSRLVSIIRTEFATELKTKRICEMVKPIAQNIDDLLLRYENKEQINSVSAKSTSKTMLQDFNEEKSPAFQALITRIERLEGPYRKQQNRKFYQKIVVGNKSNDQLWFLKVPT